MQDVVGNANDYLMRRKGGLIFLSWNKGGKFPACLSGGYTSAREVELAVKEYESGKRKDRVASRGIKNGKTKNTIRV